MFRYPDKPTPSSAPVLATLRPNDWIAQYKYDGWRCLLYRGEAGWAFTTRHHKPCPVSAALAAAIAGELAELPVGTLLDGEWMARRAGLAGNAGDEDLKLFDVLCLYPDNWATGMGAFDRFNVLRSIVGPAAQHRIVPFTYAGYADFFEQSKADPLTEGVVLKHKTSIYRASIRECYVNPLWIKCKWRDGSDGQKRVA